MRNMGTFPGIWGEWGYFLRPYLGYSPTSYQALSPQTFKKMGCPETLLFGGEKREF